jgi:type IV pilus assembly protein PilB
MLTKMRLGEFLVTKNIITRDDLSRALRYQENWGGKLGEALISLKIISEDKLLAALKYHLNLPVINLENLSVPPDVVRLIPKETAKKFKAVPVKVGDVGGKKTLFVAMANPLDLTAVEEIQFASGLRVQPVLSREKGLIFAMRQLYEIDVEYFVPKQAEPMPKGADDGMTIIRAGEEVTIKDKQAASRPEPEPVPEDISVPEDVLAEEAPIVPLERKILQALIKVLIEKGHITLAELQEKMKE